MFNLARKEDVEQLSKEIVDQQAEINNLKSNIPTVPVQSVNGKTGAVVLGASDVGATTESWVQAKINDLKAQGIQQVPLFANSVEECTDTTKMYVLPDGYIYAYTEGEEVPTNLLPLATDTDRTTIYNGKGYKELTRLSSSGSTSATTKEFYATGFIPAKVGDVVRITGLHQGGGYNDHYPYIITYDANNTKIAHKQLTATLTEITQTLDSATFGSNFNAFRLSYSGISANTVINIDGVTTGGSSWQNTGRAFVPADYEDRIVNLEEAVDEIEGKLETSDVAIPTVKFTFDHELKDVSTELAKMNFNTKETMLEQIYALYDKLVADYPDYVSKVDSAELLGMTYPTYANGVSGHTTYADTPAYKTYMYKFIDRNGCAGNNTNCPKKKLLLITGTDGHEYTPPFNGYMFAKQLCDGFLNDENFYKFRSAFDVYIIPALSGYSLYHNQKANANGVAITRNYPTSNWIEADADRVGYYTGSVAGSEFETQLVMNMTNYLKPEFCIDHHCYTIWNTQFYTELPKTEFMPLAHQSLVDISHTLQKNLPQYFGTKFKLLDDVGGSAPTVVTNDHPGPGLWWAENGVDLSGIVEIASCICYNNGEYVTSGYPDLYGATTFSIAEYTLRNQLFRYGQWVLDTGN